MYNPKNIGCNERLMEKIQIQNDLDCSQTKFLTLSSFYGGILRRFSLFRFGQAGETNGRHLHYFSSPDLLTPKILVLLFSIVSYI